LQLELVHQVFAEQGGRIQPGQRHLQLLQRFHPRLHRGWIGQRRQQHDIVAPAVAFAALHLVVAERRFAVLLHQAALQQLARGAAAHVRQVDALEVFLDQVGQQVDRRARAWLST
jgi:hypothetical protein